MKKAVLISLSLVLPFIFLITGCSVRTYPLTKDRVDQNLRSGNRGYIQGQSSGYEEKERKTTRTTHVLEIELGRKDKYPQPAAIPQATALPPASQERYVREKTHPAARIQPISKPAPAPVEMKRYKVQKGDTLQKISERFFGTTKKWHQIYEANRDTLKTPDKLYPGQTINIPLSGTPAEKIK